MVTIGIDFGYSAVRVGIYNDFEEDEVPKAEVLPNDLGDRSTPTVIAIDDQTRLVGVDAITHSALCPHNAVYGIKRIIGRLELDNVFLEHKKQFHFESKIKNGRMMCSFTTTNGDADERTFEELLAFIFHKVKESAEQELHAITGVHQKIIGAVISVPSYFHHLQRQAIMNAAEIIDLNVTRIINDNTAAAVNYVFDILEAERKTMVVLDFGASSLEISLIEANDFEIKVLSTVGTTSLGGVDFDQRLIDICVEKFSRTSKGKFSENSIRDDKRLMHKIRIECEKAKKTLQQKSDVRVKIDLPDGSDLVTQVTRKEFDDRCHDLYLNIHEFVERVFEDTDVNKNQVKEIILVGGSTRLKSLEKLLTGDGWVLNKRLNVDEAVARGAAIFANMIRLSRPIVIHEVTPFRYALTAFVDREKNTNKNVNNVTVIVDRNVALPKSGNCLLAMKYLNSKKPKNSITFGHPNKFNLKNEGSFSNGYEKHDSSFSFNINVVIDDRNKFLKYEELLKFQVTHSWKNIHYFLVDVNFEINCNGICKFEVTPKEYNDVVNSPICNSKHVTVQLNPGLSIDEIALMKSNFSKYEAEVECEKKRVLCKNILQSRLFKMKHCLKNAIKLMDKHYILVFNDKIQAISDWVDRNSKASNDELEEKIKDAENIKQEIEKCKAEYKKKVDQKIEELKNVLTKINNNMTLAKSTINSEELNVIENELNVIQNWFSDSQCTQTSVSDVDEKITYATNIIVKLNQLQLKEDQLRKDARIKLTKVIEKIEENPFPGFEHLQCYGQYCYKLNLKIREAKEIIKNTASTSTSICESKINLLRLIEESEHALTNEEHCRQESKVTVNEAVKQLEQLILSKGTKRLSPKFEQRVKDLIDNAAKWLDQHTSALSTEYAEYAKYLSQEYYAVQEEINQDNLRVWKRRELYDKVINFLKMLDGVNKNNLNDKQISLIKVSANGILDWHRDNVDAAIVQIEEKINEVKNLEQRRLIIINENDVKTFDTDKAFVGIDLGTSKCFLAVFRNSKWEIVNLESQQSRMPSYVAITGDKIIVGSEAKNNATQNIAKTIYNCKRLIGRSVTDSTYLKEKAYLTYVISELQPNKIKLFVENQKTKESYSPEQITAMLLMKIKNVAEEFLKQEINMVTISVPSMFNNAQRLATKNAALIAGFTNVSLLNDTLAVTLKYVWDKIDIVPRKICEQPSTVVQIEGEIILVVSIGAGFSSFSLIELKKNNVEVINHCGLDFGGNEFDRCLYDNVDMNLKHKFDKKEKYELLLKVENRKKELEKFGVVIDTPAVTLPNDSKEFICNKDYDSQCGHLYELVVQKLRELFVEVNRKRFQIKEVLLVGESSKLKRLKKFFNDNFAKVKEFDDKSIAVGCALHSAISQHEQFRIIRFSDVCSYKYATECKRNEAIVLDKRSKLPTNVYNSIKAYMDFAHEYPTFLLEYGDNYRSVIAETTIESVEPVRMNQTAFKLYLEVDSSGIISFLNENDKVKEEIHVKSSVRGTELGQLQEKAEKHRMSILKDVEIAKERELLSESIEFNQRSLDKFRFTNTREKEKYCDHLKAARFVLNNATSTRNGLQKRREYIVKQFSTLSQ